MDSQKYAALKAKIVEAVPEIMDLKFGCKIQKIVRCRTQYYIYTITGIANKIIGGVFPLYVKTYKSKKPTLLYLHKNDFIILGRPITLCDVLRAINKKNTYPLYTVGIDATGSFLFDRVPSGEDGRRWEKMDIY